MTKQGTCDTMEYTKMLEEAFDLIGKLSDEQLAALIQQVQDNNRLSNG